ncbi:CBS domain-containing protein [Benzoatithermus flavus]|uniref:CBS domain-containing protein n=1 Tax=Benzoatithermus flavus TaxID=3108223 RepID=A0ABU8XQS0_9PROT
MKVSDVMTRTVKTTTPDVTIREAARLMADLDAGILPVAQGDRLVGMITDRDITVRAVAQGKGPDTRVEEAMTRDVKYCYEDEQLDHVVKNMARLKVQRLPVMDRNKRLVGIVSLGDIAIQGDSSLTDTAVTGIKEPGGPHDQSEQKH